MSQSNDSRPPTVRVDTRILLPMAGILIAPFIGLLYSAEAALVILVICLGITGWFTWNLAEQAPPPQARTLRMGAILNGIMAVAALALLIIRL